MCGHTVAEHRIYSSMEFTAQKKKKLFKSVAVPEAFKRILVDNVGPRASSELMEDLTVQSHHCIRKKNVILIKIITVVHVGTVMSNCFCVP